MNGVQRITNLRTAAIILAVALLSGMILIGLRSYSQLESLRRAPYENITWVTSRFQAKYEQLLAALAQADAGRLDEAELQRHWEVLQSRVQLFRAGSTHDILKDVPFFIERFGKIDAAMTKMAQIVARHDGQMLSARVEMEPVALSVAGDVEQLSVSSFLLNQRLTANARGRFVDEIVLMLALAATLFLLLLGFIVAMFVQKRRLIGLAIELKQSNATAEAANLAKSHFMAQMSHELRTPLNAILGFSEMMQLEVLGPIGNSQYRDYLGHVRHAGQLLLALINSALDLAKIESGRMTVSEEEIDLAVACGSCLDLIRERAARGNITVGSTVSPSLPKLRADPRHLRQILLNLLSNAVKFTPPGGSVLVDAELLPDGMLSVAVTDTGVGIAPNDLPRVFEPFGHVTNSLISSEAGSGLGLSISKSLTEMNGGTLELLSEVGRGTVARLFFPSRGAQSS